MHPILLNLSTDSISLVNKVIDMPDVEVSRLHDPTVGTVAFAGDGIEAMPSADDYAETGMIAHDPPEATDYGRSFQPLLPDSVVQGLRSINELAAQHHEVQAAAFSPEIPDTWISEVPQQQSSASGASVTREYE